MCVRVCVRVNARVCERESARECVCVCVTVNVLFVSSCLHSKMHNIVYTHMAACNCCTPGKKRFLGCSPKIYIDSSLRRGLIHTCTRWKQFGCSLSLIHTQARTHAHALSLSLSLFSSLIVYLIVLPFSPESEKPCGLKMERGERGGQHKKCIIGKTD